jgi:hypothetical protein
MTATASPWDVLLRARPCRLAAPSAHDAKVDAKPGTKLSGLLAELQTLAERAEWPDGDGASVGAQMWAEGWMRRLTPNAELSGQPAPLEPRRGLAEGGSA